jgi:cell wall-associated NlpC family hydrolase
VAIFAYSPAVWVYIQSTAQGQTYDVSGDLVRGQIVLRSNAPHQMSVTLMNKNRRYDTLFSPNDLFTIYLKRVRRLQVISGYLDSVPWYSTWERSVQIYGTCTMKRLLQKRWDPGTIAALNLMTNYGNSPQQLANDGGMAQKAVALITQVGGWPEDTIHIASLPTTWAQKISALYTAANPVILGSVMGNIGGAVTLQAPNSPVVGSTSTPQSLPKSATPAEQIYFSVPDPTQGLTAVPYSGPMDIVPDYKGDYYCQLNWGYMAPGAKNLRKSMRNWLAGQPPPGSGPLMIYSSATGKTVLCDPVGDGPGKYDPHKMKIGLSPAAYRYLGITEAMVKNNTNMVYIAWCDQSVKQNHYQPGPWPRVEVVKKVKGKSTVSFVQAQVLSPNTSDSTGDSGTGKGGGSGSDPFGPSSSSATQGAKAVAFARTCIGKQYVWATMGPNTWDCSGMCVDAWLHAGVNWPVSTDRSTEQQWADSRIYKFTDPTKLQLGDLVYYDSHDSQPAPSHMGIYSGTDNQGTQMTVQAEGHLLGIHEVPMVGGGTLMGFGRPTGFPGWKGTSTNSSVAGSSSGTSSSSTSSTSSGAGFASGSGVTPETQTNTSFLNYWEWFGQAPTSEAQLLQGIRGLLNDQPLLPFINTVMNSSMRSWCSAPNGDFIAWFPDYFGAYGAAASIKVADVELMDFSMAWADGNMVTHQYVASSWVSSVFGASPAGAVNIANITQTEGVVTLEMGNVSNNILQTVLNLSAGDKSNMGNPQAILNRFGARPNFQEVGIILGPQAQFWYALFLFQLNWASMFTANVPITFMPEAFPGMLLQLEDGFQAYITQVQHNWDFTDGGPGFTTQCAIMAPSDYKNGGLFGLPNGGNTAVV